MFAFNTEWNIGFGNILFCLKYMNILYQIKAHLVGFPPWWDLLIAGVTNGDAALSETKLHALVLVLINVMQKNVLISKSPFGVLS